MINYKTTFDEANKEALEQYKNRKRNKNVWLFVSGIMALLMIIGVNNFHTTYSYLGSIGWAIISLSSIAMALISRVATKDFSASKKLLEAKAKGFATTIIFYDLYPTLEAFGRCAFERSKLKKIMAEDYIWFEDGQFVCNDLYFDYEQEKTRFVIIRDKCMFYLTSWRYVEDLPFIFTFDKVNLDGRVEKITMHLRSRGDDE